jgi:hypothetical protein
MVDCTMTLSEEHGRDEKTVPDDDNSDVHSRPFRCRLLFIWFSSIECILIENWMAWYRGRLEFWAG